MSLHVEGWPGIRSPKREGLDRQAPDHGRRLVRRQSGSDGGGDATAEARRQGGGRIPRQDWIAQRLIVRSGSGPEWTRTHERMLPMSSVKESVGGDAFDARADARLARDPGDRPQAEAGAVLRHSRALARRRCSSGPRVPPPADTSRRFRRGLVERGECLAGGRDQLCGP